jgi:hypothetical protein
MATMNQQVERTLTRPWAAAAVVAALFVALQGFGQGVLLVTFWSSPGSLFGGGSLRWEVVRSEWAIYLSFLVIGALAAYVLWRAVEAGITYAWLSLILRAAIVFIPTSLVINFVIGYVWALAHGTPFAFLGFQLLS